ncbi:hypothetical protein Pfo_005998 [Paulownia fortunei]|nr:hypothetical protein Pfo_005998 [Paulownia fortunei]
MDFVRKVYKPWKPAQIQKKFKLDKCYKKLKPAKLFKILKPLFRMLFPAAAHLHGPQTLREGDLAFMTCIIKVNANEPGWQKAVLALLRNCQGARFKMDQNGVVEVSGIADPNRLLKKLGKSRRVELQWFQFGQCSSNLFMPESKKKPVQEKPNYYKPPYNSFPVYRDYGYHYQPPQVFKPYAPY